MRPRISQREARALRARVKHLEAQQHALLRLADSEQAWATATFVGRVYVQPSTAATTAIETARKLKHVVFVDVRPAGDQKELVFWAVDAR